MVRLATALALAAAFACLSTGQQAREIQARLIGREAHAMRRCLGPPTQHRVAEGRETWHLALRLEPDEPYVPNGLDGLYVPSNSHYETERERDEKLAAFLSDPARARIPPGYCRFEVELDAAGRVTALRADGRDSRGLNADTHCMLMARRCVEPGR